MTVEYDPLTSSVYYEYSSSKTGQAFNIVGKLIEKGMIHPKTLEDFMMTVNEVAGLL